MPIKAKAETLSASPIGVKNRKIQLPNSSRLEDPRKRAHLFISGHMHGKIQELKPCVNLHTGRQA
jgi:hypothetical protein